MYGQISPSFAVLSDVQQECPISPFPFNFTMDYLLLKVFDGIANSGVELLLGHKVAHLDNADEVALLGDDHQVYQAALNRLGYHSWNAP